MRTNTLFLVASIPLFYSSCKATDVAEPAANSATTSSAPTQSPSQSAAKPATPAAPAEKFGVFTPSDAAGVALWPETYSGSLLVLEVKPHGTAVKTGEVIARLDTRPIDEEIHRVELELQSTAVRHQATLDRNKLDEEVAKSALDQAKSSLDRARRSLEGWKSQELVFTKRSDEISKSYEKANVDDQTDELDQLMKMYKADELVSETEDIVIKRSQRQLALTKTQNELARDRAKFRESIDLAMQTEQREETYRTQVEALARLVKQQEIDARSRRDAEVRSTDTLAEQRTKLERLRHDREFFAIQAPRDGVLLHGAAKDYRPGKSPSRFERGSNLATRADVFTIAAPTPSAVAFDVADTDTARFHDAVNVDVQALTNTGKARGQVHLEPYSKSISAGETMLEATAALESPLEGARYGTRARIEIVTDKVKG